MNATPPSLKDAVTYMHLAELPPDLMDLLLDSPLPTSYLVRVSELMKRSYDQGMEKGRRAGYEEGREDGIDSVVADPVSYFNPQEDEP